MSGPVIGIIGATGNIGSPQVAAYLDALKEGRVKEVRILVSEGKVNDELVQSWAKKGAKITSIDYSSVPSLSNGLAGVDVVVSTIKGPEDHMQSSWNNLLDAIVSAGVKIYFPSEFDAPLDKSPAKEYTHPWWVFKRSHFNQAKERGVKPIRMATGPLADFVLSPFLGYDPANSKWAVVGDAADNYVSIINQEDMGKFTCEAAILAYNNPSCPEEFEVYSDIKTFRKYAAELDKVSGKTTQFESVPFEAAKAQYDAIPDAVPKFLALTKLMFASGCFDYRNSKGNQILNPNQSKFKQMNFEDYAKTFGKRMTMYDKAHAQIELNKLK